MNVSAKRGHLHIIPTEDANAVFVLQHLKLIPLDIKSMSIVLTTSDLIHVITHFYNRHLGLLTVAVYRNSYLLACRYRARHTLM